MIESILIILSVIFIGFNIFAIITLVKNYLRSRDNVYDNAHARGTVRGILGLFESNTSYEKSVKKVSSKNFKF